MKNFLKKLFGLQTSERDQPPEQKGKQEEELLFLVCPEDLVELVSDPKIIPTPVLRKIIFNAIKRLDDEQNNRTSS